MQSYDTAKNVSLKAFTGGYIDNLQDIYLPEGNSPFLRNMRISGYGSENRKVAVATATTFTTGKTIASVPDFGAYSTGGSTAGYANSLLAISYVAGGVNKVRLTNFSVSLDTTTSNMSASYIVGGNKSIYLMDGEHSLGKIYDASGTPTYLDISTTTKYLTRYFVGVQPPTNMSFGVIDSSNGGILQFSPGGSTMPQDSSVRFIPDASTAQAPASINFYQTYYANAFSGTDNFRVSATVGGTNILYTAGGTQPYHVEYFLGDELRCVDDGGKIAFCLDNNAGYSIVQANLAPPHQLPNNTKIRFMSDKPGAVPPAGLSFNTDYYVLPSTYGGTVGTFFRIATSSGGTAIAYINPGVQPFHMMLSPVPNWGDVFDNRLWLLDANLPNMVIHSKSNDFDNFTDGGQYWFNEAIIGIKSTAQALFFFSSRKIYVIYYGDVIQNTNGSQSYNIRTISSAEGVINQKSIVAFGTSVYYITPTNKICNIMQRGQSINGFDVHELSHRPYKGIPKLLSSLISPVSAYYDKSNNRIKWFFSVGASGLQAGIVYDITHDGFLVDDHVLNDDTGATGKYVLDSCYSTLLTDTGGYIISFNRSDSSSTIYRDESDYSVAIPNEYRTPRYTFGATNFKKEFWESRITASITRSCTFYEQVYVSDVLVSSTTLLGSDYDFSTGQPEQLPQGLFPIGGEIGSWNTRDIAHVNTTGNLKAKGQTIQFRYTHNEVGSIFRLEGLDVKLATLPPDQLNYNSLL